MASCGRNKTTRRKWSLFHRSESGHTHPGHSCIRVFFLTLLLGYGCGRSHLGADFIGFIFAVWLERDAWLAGWREVELPAVREHIPERLRDAGIRTAGFCFFSCFWLFVLRIDFAASNIYLNCSLSFPFYPFPSPPLSSLPTPLSFCLVLHPLLLLFLFLVLL